MRSSAFAIMAPLFNICVTTTILAVDPTDLTTIPASKETDNDKKSNSGLPTLDQEQEHVATGKLSSLAVHKFPVIWNFEVDNDFAETPEMLAQMQEAFLLSANEVHNSADIKFLSAFIKSSTHEHLTDESDNNNKRKRKRKRTMMMMLNGDEQGDEQGDSYDGSDEETMDAAGGGAADPTGDGSTRTLRGGNMWNRPANRRNGNSFRSNYNSIGGVGCNLCSNDDDDAAAMLARPLEHGSAFYRQLEEGRDIQAQWQRKFCQKLRSIHSLQTASRCFIYFDLDHEEPDDILEEAAAAAVSTFTLADI